MQVKNNLLYNNDGTQVEFRQTPNISSGNKDIRFIVLHYDGASNETSAVNWLTDPRSKVSCDLHIAKSGKVVQINNINYPTYAPDGIHPNTTGAKLMSDYILAQI